MPALTQTLPTRTNGFTKDIPLNGVPAGLKLKQMMASKQTPTQPADPTVPTNGTPDDQPQSTNGPSSPNVPIPDANVKSALREVFDNDKKDFDRALSTASDAMSKVLEDLFREASSNTSLLFIIGKFDNDDFNRGVRSWNASIPNRYTPLRPLKAPQEFTQLDNGDIVATLAENTIWGLNVTIEELEAYPDAIKVALLLHVGIDPVNIAFNGILNENLEVDQTLLQELQEIRGSARLMENIKLEDRDLMPDRPQDERLTRQLRVVMGLTPFAL